MKILYMGIRGLPPKYGGFERHIDQISKYLSSKHELNVSVACEKKWNNILINDTYHGVNLIYYPLIPGPRWLSETIFDVSVFFSSLFIKDLNLIYYCGLSAGFFTFVPRLFGKTVIVNVGGFDWKSKKFNPLFRYLLYVNLLCILKFSHALVTDNQSVSQYFKMNFKKDTTLIPYAVEIPNVISANKSYILNKYKLVEGRFFLTITRIEKMNSIEYMILEAGKIYEKARKIPLVIVGDLSTAYGKYILMKYGHLEYVRFLGFISSTEELDMLRECAKIYVHGQATGGTSPALLEALASGVIIASFDSESNRITMKNTNYYFKYNYDYYLGKGTYQEFENDNNIIYINSLSYILLKIIDNWDEISRKASAENPALAISDYSIDKISQLHLELYKNLCD